MRERPRERALLTSFAVDEGDRVMRRRPTPRGEASCEGFAREQWVLALLVAGLLPSPRADAEIARQIDEKTAALKALDRASANDPAAADAIRELREAIASGERAGKELWEEIRRNEESMKALQAEKQSLVKANEDLERTKLILSSGLIGALVTAFVAIFGAVTSARRSRADSDLKRLDVIVKARELQKNGVRLPADIVQVYGLEPPSEAGAVGKPAL